jgi:hypothetical protein
VLSAAVAANPSGDEFSSQTRLRRLTAKTRRRPARHGRNQKILPRRREGREVARSGTKLRDLGKSCRKNKKLQDINEVTRRKKLELNFFAHLRVLRTFAVIFPSCIA